MERHNLLHAAAFKLRGLLMVPPLAFIALWYRGEWEDALKVWPIGLALFGAGVALRLWSQTHLRYRLHGKRTLAVAGPYEWARNPVYVANLALFAGLCVLCELPWAIPLFCGWAVWVYHQAIRFEEVRLAKRYGTAYSDYRRRVPRWIPGRRKSHAPTGSPAVGWGAAFRVEWQCLLLLVVPVVKECFARLVIDVN